MVGNGGYNNHAHQSQRRCRQLLCQVKGGASVLLQRLIRAGGIQHNQTESQKEKHNEQKAVVKEIFRLSFFLFLSHPITPSVRVHIP